MASQTIQLPRTVFRAGAGGDVLWEYVTSGRPRIDNSLTDGSARYFVQVGARPNGSVFIAFEDSASGQAVAGHDLSSTFEESGGFTLTVGANSLTVLLDGADMSSEYRWTPSNSAEVTAFVAAVGTTAVAATLTIFDRTTPPNSTRLGTSEPIYRYGASEVNAMYVGTNKVFG